MTFTVGDGSFRARFDITNDKMTLLQIWHNGEYFRGRRKIRGWPAKVTERQGIALLRLGLEFLASAEYRDAVAKGKAHVACVGGLQECPWACGPVPPKGMTLDEELNRFACGAL